GGSWCAATSARRCPASPAAGPTSTSASSGRCARARLRQSIRPTRWPGWRSWTRRARARWAGRWSSSHSYHRAAMLDAERVRVADYATFGTPELAESVLAALEGRTAALMANHGAIVYAADVPAAAELARLLEWACSVYWHASAIGTPRALDEDQRSAVIAAA